MGWEDEPTRGSVADRRFTTFRERIKRGISKATAEILNRDPDECPLTNFIKSAASAANLPNYWGRNDLVVFMRWLQNFIAYIDIQQLVGESNDFYRL